LSAQQKLTNLGFHLKFDELAGLDDQTLAERIRLLGIPDSIRATLDPQSTSTNLLPITAPFDGVVIGRDAVIGEVVTPEKAQFVVADVSRSWLLLDVRKEDANRIRRGQAVEFEVEGVKRPVVGRVDWISTEMDEHTRTLRVRAEVENPLVESAAGREGERLLKANTFGVGRIVLRETEQAVVVPPSAVHRDAQGRFVFIRRDGRFVRRNVTTGVAEHNDCEVLAGLEAGEIVAADGSHVLKAELATLAAE
jgi:membrane fusion protein, heavy metal efflux system